MQLQGKQRFGRTAAAWFSALLVVGGLSQITISTAAAQGGGGGSGGCSGMGGGGGAGGGSGGAAGLGGGGGFGGQGGAGGGGGSASGAVAFGMQFGQMMVQQEQFRRHEQSVMNRQQQFPQGTSGTSLRTGRGRCKGEARSTGNSRSERAFASVGSTALSRAEILAEKRRLFEEQRVQKRQNYALSKNG